MKKLYEDELEAFLRDNSLLDSSMTIRDKIKRCSIRMIEKLRKTNFWEFLAPVKFMYHVCTKFVNSYKQGGVKKAIRTLIDPQKETKRFVDLCFFNTEEYEKQKAIKFSKDVKFSILVPLYNTPEKYLKDMIQSVINQTYSNWELCLVDASDEKHNYVGEICKSLKDERIVYKKLDENLGISGNTNEAIHMSTGEYIALFDHDDMLCPNALYENMRMICEKGADFVYSDEAVFEENNIYDIISFHFKPDFAIDNLRANNYICHFTVFKKSLLDLVGEFDPKCDGSQDHDMVLRLTEHAERIEHIPKVIYFWRSHKNSVAQDINSKRYAIDAGILAVTKHLKRVGLQGKVESSPVFPTIYRIRYEIKGHPLISIIIVSKNDLDNLAKCIDSILRNSTYDNFEIIIVNNGTTDPKQKKYYQLIEQIKYVKVCRCDGGIVNAYDYGVNISKGEYVVFLRSMISIVESQWMEELLMYAQRSDVGAVGAKIYNTDDTVKECGLIIGGGEGGIVMRSHEGVPKSSGGYMGRLFYAQNVSAVSDLCLMIAKNKFKSIGGFKEKFGLYYDVKFCLDMRQLNYINVVNPYVELKLLCNYNDDNLDCQYMKQQLKDNYCEGDKYYNCNLLKKILAKWMR